MKFAKSLLHYEMAEFSALNIIGFNAPEWFFAFYGSLMARCIPVGIYTTNNK
jgi:long-chain-fatty-acid--CoA ligase ACSBG